MGPDYSDSAQSSCSGRIACRLSLASRAVTVASSARLLTDQPQVAQTLIKVLVRDKVDGIQCKYFTTRALHCCAAVSKMVRYD